jgi:hypothetical protein
MTQRFFRVLVYVTISFACSATMALSQSNEDRETLKKARSAYLLHPVPGSIACNVELDWDRFFQEMKIEMKDDTKARLEKLRAVKISVISKGEDHTEVRVDAPDGLESMADGLRQQLSGFFQTYWAESYGKILAVKPEDTFALTKVPMGYNVKLEKGATKVEIDMDKAYFVTGEKVLSPEMNASITPEFKPGADGLLRLRSMDETIELGATKMVVHLDLDYQKVGEFDIPQHVHMSLPGAYGFEYTFVGCEVKGRANESPESKK